MTTRQECLDKIHYHAGVASEVLSTWEKDADDADLEASALFVAAAHAHAATAQAWAALHETMFGGTVRIDRD